MKTTATYNREFWNSIKNPNAQTQGLSEGISNETGGYYLPSEFNSKYQEQLAKENVFRTIATVKSLDTREGTILVAPNTANIDWVEENGVIKAVSDATAKISIKSHKLAGMLTVKSDFLKDSSIDVEKYFINEFAHHFGKTEEESFISGDGSNKPIGILDDENGAQTGITTTTNDITFDEVTALFLSLDSDYRKNAVWLLNDETCLYLRSLKDENGAYLWRDSHDFLLGKPVVISNNMPNMTSGAKPLAFGDFSYYWITQRKSLSIKTLVELYKAQDVTAFIGSQRLDGKLIRSDAIKILQVLEEVDEE